MTMMNATAEVDVQSEAKRIQGLHKAPPAAAAPLSRTTNNHRRLCDSGNNKHCKNRKKITKGKTKQLTKAERGQLPCTWKNK